MYAFRRSKIKVKDDVEAGTLYSGPSYGDNELRWGFIRKVYAILTAQILLTTLVSAVVVFYSPISHALKDSPGLLLGFSFLPLILMFPLYIYQQLLQNWKLMQWSMENQPLASRRVVSMRKASNQFDRCKAPTILFIMRRMMLM